MFVFDLKILQQSYLKYLSESSSISKLVFKANNIKIKKLCFIMLKSKLSTSVKRFWRIGSSKIWYFGSWRKYYRFLLLKVQRRNIYCPLWKGVNKININCIARAPIKPQWVPRTWRSFGFPPPPLLFLYFRN